ncbi:hypothetical protein FACS189485_00490 [Spirochaetia bacterium]|nr:hypothetical protein FACS189485_00490 [Spirochaetia bacterium]
MAERIIHFEVEGKAALGFDTGLSSQAFAQAKLAQFITQEGLIVYPDGKLEPWQPSAVIERSGAAEDTPTMVIWGPDFKGERFDFLLKDEARRDDALDALRLWIGAQSAAKGLPPWPAGVLINLSEGTILFPPDRLVTRSIQAEHPTQFPPEDSGKDAWFDGAESLVNTELAEEEEAAFTAGAILYRLLSGTLPFPNRDQDLLHQDIREGVFLPVRLAAPGLDEKTAALIDRAIASSKNAASNKAPGKTRPALDEFREILGPIHSQGADAFFHPLDEAEQAKIAEEGAQFQKKKDLTVNARRFVIRNAAIITAICAIVLIAGLIVRSVVVSNANLPTTAGMESAEVIETYYGAFGVLDHTLMDACVFKKAGKGDIEMVTNLFVMDKVRSAYETSMVSNIIPAEKWLESGAEPTVLQVFGVSDLNFSRISGDESGDEIHYRASYILWVPAGFGSPTGAEAESVEGPSLDEANAYAEPAPILPKGYPYTDEITLIRVKGNWRIAEINRTVN